MSRKSDKPRLKAPVLAADHVRGGSAATVTVVGYGDFANPNCAETYRVVKQTQKKVGNRLRYVFRSFPTSEGGVTAQRAAEAAECAGAQGKFWEMHDRLFQNPGGLNEFRLARHAAAVGLDVRRFQREMVSHVHAPRIRDVVAGGVQSGVEDTPALFINSVRFRSSFGLATFLASVQAATGN